MGQVKALVRSEAETTEARYLAGFSGKVLGFSCTNKVVLVTQQWIYQAW